MGLCPYDWLEVFEGDVELFSAAVGLSGVRIRSFEARVGLFGVDASGGVRDSQSSDFPFLDGLRGGHPREETMRDTRSALLGFVTGAWPRKVLPRWVVLVPWPRLGFVMGILRVYGT
ncbi:hypothetical protein Tco_1476482 [Tanacetum coccineum]